MSDLLLKLDSTNYNDYCFNYQQFVILTELFNNLKDNKELNIFFEYNPLDEKFIGFLTINKTNNILYIPLIDKQNRKWIIENIIIHEQFMIEGENSLYIINDIVKKLNNDCSIYNFRNEFSNYLNENKK